MSLESLDTLAQRGLRDLEIERRLSEASGLGHRYEIAQAAQIHCCGNLPTPRAVPIWL